MGKKSKKGKSRAGNVHHNKAKRAAKVKQMRKEPSSPPKEEPPKTVEPEIVDETQTPPATSGAAAAATATAAPTPAEEKPQAKQDSSTIPSSPLMSNLHLFTPSQAKLANKLVKIQPHMFEKWSVRTTDDDEKKVNFMKQLVRMDQAYPSGGLVGYVKNAQVLLEKSRKGENPLEGWAPSVPDGEMFEIGTDSYAEFESLGLKEMGKCGFALVAGGLGERLGYGGIKVRYC